MTHPPASPFPGPAQPGPFPGPAQYGPFPGPAQPGSFPGPAQPGTFAAPPGPPAAFGAPAPAAAPVPGSPPGHYAAAPFQGRPAVSPAFPGPPVAPFPGPPAVPASFPGPPAAPLSGPPFSGAPLSGAPFPGAPLPGTPAAPPGAGPSRDGGQPGWWRRNWWGLLLLVPALAGALSGPYLAEAREYLRDTTTPSVPVAAAADGWSPFAGARMRLEQLTEVKNVTDRSRKPLAIGSGTVWKATVAYDDPSTEKSKLDGCTVYLEDTTGRRFGDRPNELARADIPTGSGCGRPSSSSTKTPPAAGTRYQATYYFLLPKDAAPASVWITVPTESPSYARLPRP
ncbi:hypothetical protein ABZS66_26740 [Dactylosporangium sp. NPDC005572]|uniref:hypothetical protein n=1 Tax=Dactylosporangium sp. NPDC005572 TaxID=3156889 RepID=UPI0033B61BBD